MLNSGKKFRAMRDKKKYSNSCVRKKIIQIIFFFLHQNQNIFFSNIGNQNIFLEKKHNPPLQVKWSFPYTESGSFRPDYLFAPESESIRPTKPDYFVEIYGKKITIEELINH
jgi:hypothetical protein